MPLEWRWTNYPDSQNVDGQRPWTVVDGQRPSWADRWLGVPDMGRAISVSAESGEELDDAGDEPTLPTHAEIIKKRALLEALDDIVAGTYDKMDAAWKADLLAALWIERIWDFEDTEILDALQIKMVLTILWDSFFQREGEPYGEYLYRLELLWLEMRGRTLTDLRGLPIEKGSRYIFADGIYHRVFTSEELQVWTTLTQTLVGVTREGDENSTVLWWSYLALWKDWKFFKFNPLDYVDIDGKIIHAIMSAVIDYSIWAVAPTGPAIAVSWALYYAEKTHEKKMDDLLEILNYSESLD